MNRVLIACPSRVGRKRGVSALEMWALTRIGPLPLCSSSLTCATPDCSVSVYSEDNVHYEAVIVSRAFAGKSSVKRHQMVYGALGDRIGGAIHALSIKTLTPEERMGRGA